MYIFVCYCSTLNPLHLDAPRKVAPSTIIPLLTSKLLPRCFPPPIFLSLFPRLFFSLPVSLSFGCVWRRWVCIGLDWLGSARLWEKVVANAVAALSEIGDTSGRDVMEIDTSVLQKLLAALNECTEWGQVSDMTSGISIVTEAGRDGVGWNGMEWEVYGIWSGAMTVCSNTVPIPGQSSTGPMKTRNTKHLVARTRMSRRGRAGEGRDQPTC